MNKLKAFLVIFILIVIMGGGLTLTMILNKIPENPAGTVGNTGGNLYNDGLFCENEGQVFFANPYDENTLYVMNPDETENKKLTTVSVKSINAAGKYVYYYQDDCYIPCLSTEENFEQLWANVDENIIEELKALNDWNKEFDESKCTKAKISKKMPKSELDLQDYQFFRPIKSYVETEENPKNDNFQCQYFLYCNSNSSGKELYYVCTRTGYHYAVIVNADGSFSDSAVVEVDPTTYHKRIKELKQQNGWR